MTTTYQVTSRTGELLGIFPQGELAAVKSLVDANPDAQVRPVVSVDNPCATHPAYEADYCPGCGTARRIGH